MAYPYADRLKGYRQQVDFCLEQGEGPVLRPLREDIDRLELTVSEEKELVDIDAGAIDYLLTLDEVAAYLLEDDDSHPLSHWWWHLGKIRNHSYPVELLPAHLQTVYQAGIRHAA